MIPAFQLAPESAADARDPAEPLLKPFLQRLLGIGYQGWIAVQCPRDEATASPTLLADALHKLQEWAKPPEAKKPAHRAAPVAR
jgi:hypothetical protein